MESHASTPIIVEFNGLPGCGKTTIKNQLSIYLSKANIRFEEFNCFKIKSIFPYLLNIKVIKLYFLLRHYSISTRGAIDNRHIKYVLFFYILYTHYNRKDGILLVDQGIIQSLLSISHMSVIKGTTYLSKILNFTESIKGFVVINCKNDAEVSFDRIKGRELNGCRLENFEDAKLYKALKTQKDNLEVIRNGIPMSISSLELNTLNTIENNARQIYEYII